MASFEVVCMSNSPSRHIAVFVNHYRKAGARRIRIFYDAELAHGPALEGAEIIECTGSFWEKLNGQRPDTVEERQRILYNHAYSSSIADWFLVVDIDEFVFGKISLSDFLDLIPDLYSSVRFPVAEAVFESSQNINQEYSQKYFRFPCNKYISQLVSHSLNIGFGHIFIRCLLGHSRGKHAVRTGLRNASVHIHETFCDGIAVREFEMKELPHDKHLMLAHFDAISFDQWREKWRRRIQYGDTKEMGKKRDQQMELFRQYDERDLSDLLFRKLYCIGKMKFNMMRLLQLSAQNTLSISGNFPDAA